MMIKKRWQSVGAITVLFLMIAALIIPAFASLEQKQQIMRFEKIPQFTAKQLFREPILKA